MNKAVICLAASLLFTTGCEPTKVVLTAENIDQDRLIRKIKQQQINNKGEFDSLNIAFNTEHEITISGKAEEIEKIIHIADKFDHEMNYHLEISNTNQAHINSREESLSVLLFPGQTVSLGESIWQSSPWKHYRGTESHKLLELTLDHDLMLDITMSNGKNNKASFISGSFQLREDRWIQITGGNLNNRDKNRKTKVISTRKPKELWLRLTEANSQEANN